MIYLFGVIAYVVLVLTFIRFFQFVSDRDSEIKSMQKKEGE